MTENTVQRPRVLSNDEVAARIGELEDQFTYPSPSAAVYAHVIRAKAAASAAAGKAGAFTRQAAQATKVSLAAGAAGNLLRAATVRATALVAKVRGAIDVPATVGLLVFSQDARETAAKVLTTGWSIARRVLKVVAKPFVLADKAIDKTLRTVRLGKVADWRNRNALVVRSAIGAAGRYVALQGIRALLWLNAHEHNSGFRWARWFFQYRAFSAFSKALIPAPYRTYAYIAWLFWTGRSKVVEFAPVGEGVTPMTPPFVADRVWKVSPVSVIRETAAGPLTSDAEWATTTDGHKVLSMGEDFYSEGEIAEHGWKVVPRGSVTYLLDGVHHTSTESLEAAESEKYGEPICMDNRPVQAAPRKAPARRPAKTGTSPAKGTATPKQQKKRPARPPRKAPAPASA